MDCFYAAVHMRDDQSLRGKPVVVGGTPQGRGVVAAASYEARRYGIHSAMAAAQAVKLCPHAVFLRPDFPRYVAESREVFAIYADFTPVVQPASLDEAYLDVTDHLGELGTATRVARRIRERVREERRLTVSVGVGPNRLVAKIASDFRKPDGLTVVPPERVQAFLDPLPVRTLHGVGPATERRLAQLGIRRVEELRAFGREALVEALGESFGEWLHEASHGIDERPVEVSSERKSLGQEQTYAQDLEELAAMDRELEELAEEVARGLGRRRLTARTVTVKVRYADFTTLTRSRTLGRPTASAETLAVLAQQLLRRTEAPARPVRLLGVTASGLGPPPEQLGLFEAPAASVAEGDGPTEEDGFFD
jgi:DNA polymerase-4